MRERLLDPEIVRSMGRARQVLDAVPEVREDLVFLFRKQVEEGRLPLDGKILADRILQETVLNVLV